MIGELFIVGGILSTVVLFWIILPILRGGALWIPMKRRVVDRMLKLVRLKDGELLLDLGSGDGRIPILAAKGYGARAIGVELNFFLVWWARLKACLAGVKGVEFIWQDFWKTDVKKADVITLYLYDWSTPKVGKKLLRECKSSVRVVSYLWKLGRGWRIVAEDVANGVRVYRKA